MVEVEGGTRAAVEKWLNTQGYPLEYKAYWAFVRHFADSCGLGSYIAAEGATPREIDVYAFQTHLDLHRDAGFHLRVICECKYSKAKPWVLLYGNQEKSWFVADWMHTPRSRALEQVPSITDSRSEELSKKLAKAFHFSEGVWLAHNLLRAFTKPGEQDSAYNSLRKITHAAWDFIRIAEDTVKSKMYEMVFPCLVVAAPLIGARFNPKTGRIQTREIKYGRVCWQGCRNGTNVDVVHESALAEYAQPVNESFMMYVMPVLLALYDV